MRSFKDVLTTILQWGWEGDKWVSQKNPCGFNQWSTKELTGKLFNKVKMVFAGDSTTRSDLRAFEESNSCKATLWDEAAHFQVKGSDGKHECQLWEQSMDLEKCGTPLIIDSPEWLGVSFRYLYKVWPWANLDAHILSTHPETFQDVDVVVLSNGRWYPLWNHGKYGELDIANESLDVPWHGGGLGGATITNNLLEGPQTDSDRSWRTLDSTP